MLFVFSTCETAGECVQMEMCVCVCMRSSGTCEHSRLETGVKDRGTKEQITKCKNQNALKKIVMSKITAFIQATNII